MQQKGGREWVVLGSGQEFGSAALAILSERVRVSVLGYRVWG